MKKSLFLAIIALFFFACNNNSPKPSPEQNHASDPTTNSSAHSPAPNPNTEKKTEQSYQKYTLDQNQTNQSKTSTQEVLASLPSINDDFALLRSYVAPISEVELYTNAGKFQGYRLPNNFFEKQNTVIYSYEGDFKNTVFGTGTTLNKKKIEAETGLERITDHSIDLYAKFASVKGKLALGTLNDHTGEKIDARRWFLFFINDKEEIVSATDMFFDLFQVDGKLYATYTYASDDFSHFYTINQREDGFLDLGEVDKKPEALKKLEAIEEIGEII